LLRGLLDAARNKDESAVEELEGIFVDFLGDFRSRLEKEKEGNFWQILMLGFFLIRKEWRFY
jgi:hypothetical protein